MMEINYDKQADAIYIKLRNGTFARNKKIDDWTIADVDIEDNMLGIELLQVSKRFSDSLSKIHLKKLISA